ncbi:MAG: FtsX-like permease family protein, partial [Bacteroidota bacterium]|nr:FtsX-like permease family protein [Bacteroidota bacterium]
PVDDKLTNVVKSHLDFDEGEDEKYRTRFMLSPVKDIHLHSYFGYGHPPGQIQNVIIFSTIGIFILIIAGINYMNLSTARSSRRAREIGLRKVVGARRKNLIFQFLGESLLTTIFATILSLIFVNLLLGKFNQLSGKEIEFSFLLTKEFVFGLIGVVFFTGILAGTYPALLLSRFLPVIVLKSATGDSSQRAWFRKGLVIVQFTLSIFLITGTLLVYKQLKHMQAEKLGYDKDHVFYVRMFGEINSSYSTIRDALKRNPEVINISASGHLPSNIGSNASGADWDGKDPEMRTLIGMSAIDFDYIETLKIPIIKGRSISREFPSDLANDSTGSWLVNEEVVKIMGVENPVGMRFSFSGVSQGRIVGVIKNFHFKSMRNEIEPLAIIAAPTQYLRFLLVRIGPGNIDQIMSQLEDSWKEVLPNYPFDYHFLDEDYEDMYRTEDRMGGLLKYFAFMSVFIASLGLFGLAAYMAETRTREIGIRKVFGSSISGVVYMMTGEFAKLVILAVVIGVPVSWYFLNNWLEDYAYRTSLSWWIFGLPALFSILVAIITVSFQALKAANKNPANTLRYE